MHVAAAAACSANGVKPQRAAKLACIQCWPQHGLGELFESRLLKWWPEKAAVIQAIDWPSIQSVLRTVPPSWAWSWIRTMSGAWLTSHRILNEGGRRGCIFGCEGEPDRQVHYASCPRLA
eukprot:6541049-Pyramimonas_sp.AAC.1